MPEQSRLDQGAARVYLDIANALNALGHEATVWGIESICDEKKYFSLRDEKERISYYSHCLKEKLLPLKNEFDIIDFDYRFFSFKREEYSKDILFIARSVLLWHHLEKIDVPTLPRIRSYIGKFVKYFKRKKELQWKISNMNQVFLEADYVNVSNSLDKELLVERGLAEEKILLFHYGLRSDELEAYKKVKKSPSKEICFIGTFDPRKGAREFPKIVRSIRSQDSGIKFLLLGTRSIFYDENSVLEFFDKRDREFIKIVPKFIPTDLPELIKKSSLGIFPSYYEGFGYGVIEMMASGMPVLAYDCPGPHDILPSECLFEIGDWEALTKKGLQLLEDDECYEKMKSYCEKNLEDFKLNKIIQEYDRYYQQIIKNKSGKISD